MYTLKVPYGDYDDIEGRDTETSTVEILGTYETWDEACAAAEDKFAYIMDLLGDDLDVRFDVIQTCRDSYFVRYGYYDCELGCVDNDSYCMVSVIER